MKISWNVFGGNVFGGNYPLEGIIPYSLVGALIA
jgi:hypothetical protein